MDILERAIDRIKKGIYIASKRTDIGNNEEVVKELKVTLEALKKQIPKRVAEINTECSYFMCQCGFTVGYANDDPSEHKYCLECGQKLDWEG